MDFIYYVLAIIIILSPVIALVYPVIQKQQRESGKKSRGAKVARLAKLSNTTMKTYFSQPVKDCATMETFYSMLDPTFCNVLEKLDKENGDLYIGELEWDVAVEKKRGRRRSIIDFAMELSSNSLDDRYIRVKHSATFCILYDNGFKLPNFELSKETLDKKATELLRMNKTEDIDFQDDKEFSSAWWLTSNENIIVRELFTKTIRSSFMKFVNKGYKICGQSNFIFILTNDIIQPDHYSEIMSDLRAIQRFLKTNKKFYTPYSEREQQ
ncbi:MAG: hypothetical protein J6Z11_00350 [Candidatus Riflebacteria bacterium]|nr:hypothetical protein [Candidatus Riflebacteria bacterium]